MRVSANPENQGRSEKTSKTSSRKREVTSKAKKQSTADVASHESATPDAEVKLSAKAKTKPELKPAAAKEIDPSKEIKSAEILMDHIDSGKLSPAEHDAAMKRVGEIIKKYGTKTGNA